ncbi:ABC transporter ATP-binding protein [Natronorubrum thiooxidans]|uniref:Molybdate/tungstate import ATP-binding protein WtpC n=1 Tax=Natronorubrum thiooxidans TaxID=308853 RepID=A0A1N7H2Z1_9EURY|nr:ABC transporter ATP-binding protein [Natronorubrum thiooxidans]SIS19173.1 ABC-2 type transport system ATP-binding protein/spermidine/putrescine transport system ATP-binding protein [Natronorubrum thiooxidans]
MLKATNLRKEYGSTVAVEDVDFEIETGSFATIVGPSGCGKSTLLRMLAGHLSPTAGQIELDGIDITDSSPQSRPTSLVFQSWSLFPHMTVAENIEFPIDAQGLESNGRIETLLEQVRLDPEEYANKQVTDLSGGQKQRVALARSLAYEPDILLLDEPLASLDYVLQKKLQRELTELNAELNTTFIYVTHSLESALIMSDQLFVIDDGSIIQRGSPDEIYQEPVDKFVAEFMGDANVFPIDVVERADGRIRIDHPVLEGRQEFPYGPADRPVPECLVVRHDDTVVKPSLEHELGIPVTVVNVLNKGNTALVETRDKHEDAEYVSEMSLEQVSDISLTVDDDAYLQWNPDKTHVLPKGDS